MRRINYLCLGIGILISLYIFIFKNNVWNFIDTFSVYAILSIGIKKYSDKSSEKRITFFNLWVTIYNLLYVLLINLSDADLLGVNWRYFVQLLIPFIIITINKFYEMQKKNSN